MKLSFTFAAAVVAVSLPAAAAMRDADRKAPPPIKADLQPQSYLMIDGYPPKKVFVEEWIIELFTLESGQAISRQQYLEIQAYRAKVLLR